VEPDVAVLRKQCDPRAELPGEPTAQIETPTSAGRLGNALLDRRPEIDAQLWDDDLARPDRGIGLDESFELGSARNMSSADTGMAPTSRSLPLARTEETSSASPNQDTFEVQPPARAPNVEDAPKLTFRCAVAWVKNGANSVTVTSALGVAATPP